MHPFIHLHVHTQYSVLDGQASVSALVDKAIDNGMPGIAITDHGNMFAIKEFFNYVNKKNGKTKGAIKDAEKELATLTKEGNTDAINEKTAEIEKLKKKIFKPIFGCEMYVAQKTRFDRVDKRDTGRHLVVLAKNETGYHNLIKIVSRAWTEGFYSHPRTDKGELEAHKEGLIICSACLGGEIPRLIQAGETEEAERQVQWWKETFGNDYYIELQRHKTDLPDSNKNVYEVQEQVNPELIRIAKKYDIKLVATNDVHFVNAEDAEAHDRLICVSTNKYVADANRMRYTKQEWMKTQEEMNEIFSDIPEALSNTLEILNKVETYSIDNAPIMPTFDIPKEFGTEEEYRQRLTEKDLFDEFTQDENGNVVLSEDAAHDKIKKLGGYEKLYRIKFEADYLKKLAYDGAKKRYGDPLTPELDERIKFELHIMKTMGFPGYFLIVQDFINVAREQLGVSVGPGRGSAAGSAVAYCLGITQIDPVKYDLLFERFLNPDRISLPDIDIDFDDDGRADVLRYVTEKYGEEKVAHIITYGTMAAKSAIKDVARVQQLPLSESDRLTKLIPKHMPEVNGKELKPTLKNCYEHVPEFKTELDSNNVLITDTLKFAQKLEGNVRNTGVHACGVIICRDPITDWVPVSTADDKENGKLLVTQYEGRVIEETGLIKMDFLGLKTLSIIKEAVANIKLTRGIDIDIDNIDIEDKKTYQLYCKGRTTGTFQFESAGMQKYLRELQPTTFEDLIAMNALYRPGPMDYIPDFIARKHGRSPIVFDIPIMEKYLKDTYGVTVYQEQVMLLSRLLANFTRGQSDTLRKAMGKKMIDKMNELKALFIEGGQKNGHDEKVLNKIWADWEKFASYAFNKSHATCYSWVAYQTAYLKANYPAEYMAAVLSRNLNDQEKLTKFMDECKSMKIPVKGPDINESFKNFSANKAGEIRFGLGGIKTVGMNAVEAIIEERNANGSYKSVYDFFERVNLSTCNRRTIEALVLAGCFDCFGDISREDFFERNTKDETYIEQLLKYGSRYQSDINSQATSLFGCMEENVVFTTKPPIPQGEKWADIIKLDKEREYVGMYLSAHPLDPYYLELEYGCNTKLKDIREQSDQIDKEFIFGGLVVDYIEKPTKNGSMFGIMKIEDNSGSYEIRLFQDKLLSFRNYGIVGTPIIARGAFQKRKYGDDVDFNLISMELLEKVKGSMIHSITININNNEINEAKSHLLKKFITSSTQNKGNLFFNIYDTENEKSIVFYSQLKVAINKELIDFLKNEQIEFDINKN